MLYVAVSEDREENIFGNTYTRVRISMDLTDMVKTDEEKLLKLEVSWYDKSPEEIVKDFLGKYEKLPFADTLTINGNKQMCFRNANSNEIKKCVQEYFL